MVREMNQPNNPAGRLLALCRAIKASPSNRKNERGHEVPRSIQAGWSEILGLKDAPKSVLLRRLGSVLEMPAIAVRSVECLDDIRHDLFLEWVNPISNAFGQLNLEAHWDQLKAAITEISLKSLEFCDHELERQAREPVIDKEKLDSLLTEVRSVLESLKTARLPDYLREFVLERLLLVETAIVDYQLLGIRPLREVVESTIGAVVLDKRLQPSESVDDTEAFWCVMGKVAHIVTVVAGVVQTAQITGSWMVKLLTVK